MLKNYYDIFRVPRDAKKAEITRAYETLINECAERYTGEEFDKKAAILDKAYSVLSDKHLRARYDDLIWELEGGNEEASAPKESGRHEEERNKPVMKKFDDQEEEEEEPPREKKKLTGLIIAIAVAFLLIAGGGFYFYNYIYLPQSHYKEAEALFKAGKFDDAIEAFEELKGYKNSQGQIVAIQRAKAYQLVDEKKFDEAIKAFNTLGKKDDVVVAKKAQADDLLSSKEYDKALAIYQEISDTEGINNCKYTRAKDYVADNNIPQAYILFKELGDFKDSADKVVELQNTAQTKIVNDLGNISESQFTMMPFDNAKQTVLNLNKLDTEAKTFGLDDLLPRIEEKWTLVDKYYYSAYGKNASETSEPNTTYFETIGMTNTDSVSRAPSNITNSFAEKPEYVSLYVKCLPGISLKELNVTWYQYKLDRATAEFKERTEIDKSAAVKLPAIKKNYSTLFKFEKNSFTYGTGLYAAEVTAKGDTEPCALIYFYVQ